MSSNIHVIRATVDPSAAPTDVGAHWINTSSGAHWLANGTSAVGDWQLVGAGGADTYLSNLDSPTAINQNLLPVTDNTKDIGSSSLNWKDIFMNGYLMAGSTKILTHNSSRAILGDDTDASIWVDPATDNILMTTAGNNAGQIEILTNFFNLEGGQTGPTELRFYDWNNFYYLGFKAPMTVPANVTWILPDSDGGAGDVLSTDGAGNLSWATPSGGGGGVDPGIALEMLFNATYRSNYRECAYTSGVLDQIDVWNNSGKTTHIFSKAFTYSGGNLTQTLITNIVTGATLTKTFTYSGGLVATVTRSYVP